MRNVTILITILILSGCMWSHTAMDHGDNKDGSNCHQHQDGGNANKT